MTESHIRTLMQEDPEQGYKAIFETYYRYVYAIVYRRMQGHPHMDIEECVIDVFTETMRRFDSIRNGSLPSYIATTAHHKAINASRSLSAKSRLTISMDSDDFGELPSNQDIQENFEQSELSRKLLECINQMFPEDPERNTYRQEHNKLEGDIPIEVNMYDCEGNFAYTITYYHEP